MSHNRRLEKLEHAAGITGGNCPGCKGGDVARPWFDDRGEPMPGPVRCPRCGRDRLLPVIIRHLERDALSVESTG